MSAWEDCRSIDVANRRWPGGVAVVADSRTGWSCHVPFQSNDGSVDFLSKAACAGSQSRNDHGYRAGGSAIPEASPALKGKLWEPR